MYSMHVCCVCLLAGWLNWPHLAQLESAGVGLQPHLAPSPGPVRVCGGGAAASPGPIRVWRGGAAASPGLESGGGWGYTPVVHWLISAPQVKSATSTHTLRRALAC